MTKPITNEERLRRAIKRVSKAWAEIYAKEPDGPLRVKSLLLGVERGIRARLGNLPEDQRGPPDGIAYEVFWKGDGLARNIPNSVIDRLRS